MRVCVGRGVSICVHACVTVCVSVHGCMHDLNCFDWT